MCLFFKRGHAEPNAFPAAYRASLVSRTVPVVRTYLDGTFVDLGSYRWISSASASRLPLKVKYHFLVVLFLVASVGVCMRRKRHIAANTWRSSLALVAMTWFSILAPLSWFVVFKAHSFIHTHMNFIVWQMPFTIFGFAVCGLAVKMGRKNESASFSADREMD